MSKYFKILLFGLLIFVGCEDTEDTEDEPTEVTLWGVEYSIENTTQLDLNWSSDRIQIAGPIPPEIGQLTNLTYLGLRNNLLSGPIPPEIGNLTNLYQLFLEGNNLSGPIPPEIGNLTNLIDLSLDNNEFSGVIPDEICNQGDDSPSLHANNLCPPYPDCVPFIGEQNTSDCP